MYINKSSVKVWNEEMIKEKYGIYDDDGNRYGKAFDTYEDAEWYMKEHQNIGSIPELSPLWISAILGVAILIIALIIVIITDS